MKNIVLGVSGGIAAYKAVALARLLVEAGHEVHIVPTADALRFVGQPTWEAISRQAKHFGLMDRVEKAIQITEQLQSRDIKAKEFTELALNCFKEIRNLIFELNILGSFKEKQFNPQKYNFEYTDESNSEFSSRMELNFEGMQEQMMTNFSRVYGNKSKLFAFSSNLKIQN